MSEPIRVFVGTEEKTELARKVLEYSIEQNTDSLVEFVPMIGPQWEYPLDGIKVGTGFSLRRWMIPAFCNWQGRAIYLDADIQCFGDIAELFRSPETCPSPGASVWCTFQPDKYSKTPWPQTSVMVIDCEAARGEWGWEIAKVLAYLRGNSDREFYADFMHCVGRVAAKRKYWTKLAPVGIATAWNGLNTYVADTTKLLHYTKEPEQCWYKPEHPLAPLWQAALVETIEAGRIGKEEFVAALDAWGKKEDWRNTNGLHPWYRRYLSLFPA